MMTKIKIVHYINQFFGQIGGEDKADQLPIIKEGFVGPGMALQKILGDEAEIVATVICGDTYFAEHMEDALGKIIKMIDKYKPQGVIAGPGFNAGRYGIACGAVCNAVQKRLNIPAVTALYPENPGVELYHKDVYILKTGNSAVVMRDILPKLGVFALKLFKGEEIGFPEEDGYIPQGRRVNVWAEKTGAVRGVEMLLKKLKGEKFVTELPMPVFDRVTPAEPIGNLKEAIIALVTSGGIVPKGNPDHIESANASKFGKYNIEGIDDLLEGEFETVHGGYDPVYALQDPDRVLPLDAMRILEKEGKFGKLFNHFYSTVGNTTAVSSANKFGEEIGKDLLANGAHGVILTST
jgi:betaine reductase